MGEQDIRAAGASTQYLLDAINRQTEELRRVMAPMEQLPKISRDNTIATQKALQDLQNIMVKMRIADISAEIEGKRQLLEGEKKALQEKIAELDNDTERVSIRYREIMDDLDSEARKRVRALDAPVLDLLSSFFPTIINQRYSDHLLPNRAKINQTATAVKSDRHSLLSKALNKLFIKIKSFIEKQNLFSDKIAQQIVQPIEGKNDFLIPVMVTKRGYGYDLDIMSDVPDKRKTTDLITGRLLERIGDISPEYSDGYLDILSDALTDIEENHDDPNMKKAAGLLKSSIEAEQLSVCGIIK